MSLYVIVLSLSLYAASFIFSLLKIYSPNKKKRNEVMLAFIAFSVAGFSLYLQINSANTQKQQSTQDGIKHVKEVIEARAETKLIQRQNDSLTNKINSISTDNHSLIQSVSSFKQTFKTTSKRQDSIFTFMTGGGNLPLIEAKSNSNDNSQSISNEIHVFCENYGTVPLRDVNYIIRNSQTKEVIDERIPSIAFQRSIDIYKFSVPNNLDSCVFDCTVIWPGIELRTYTAHFFVYQKTPAAASLPTCGLHA